MGCSCRRRRSPRRSSARSSSASAPRFYPTLLAAISDSVAPVVRAASVGVYRFWRDIGYVAGGLLVGGLADLLDFGGAIAVVAALTATSGLWVAFDMPGKLRPPAPRSDPIGGAQSTA